ncbi:MAG: hypothetical protein A2Y14_00870 [Verrucomicrobia bacterium GWF2_51_19]|nr:MAG: hypothetical protein A2Y14_00870 [Verrucomicrobia bacterium GWF2_51_19]HAD82581.1 hypothetical protein [Candidatus Edwardsbacteria bacterium]
MKTKERWLKLMEAMLLSRLGDQREQNLIRQGKGLFHVSGMGHEAIAGVAMQLNEEDFCFPYYRDRAFALARGISNYDLALAYFAQRESSSGGRQLPAHYSDREKNVWSHLSPVAAHLLPACGAALGMKLDGKKGVVVASVGDGSTRQGDFFESLCFAKEQCLPVLFIVEDNEIAISTDTRKTSPLSLGMLSEEWEVVDGSDASALYATAESMIKKIRHGEGPQFLWCKISRLGSHSSADDHRIYRTEAEIDNLLSRDPVRLLKEKLQRDGLLTEEHYREMEERLREQVRADYDRAMQAERPKEEDMFSELFGKLNKKATTPILEPGKSYRMADAIQLTFERTLKSNKVVVFMGEDVADPLGGVFRLTKGLSSQFPGRVINAPLAESTIVGVACGLAAYGKRPVFEIQFIDFIFPAWNQLVQNMATLRWRSFGAWKCPAIIYATYGGYLPGGALWHSQAQESAIAHFPGLQLAIPSTPEDATGVFQAALSSEDPTVILIPKHLLWAHRTTPTSLESVELGKARIRQSGDAVTVVAWGNTTEVVEQALNLYSERNGVEFIDLRSIVPWDRETLKQSVRKTGRLVVVQEDSESCSVGQALIATLLQDVDTWNAFKTPPVLVSKGDVHIGYSSIYEYGCLPSADRVLRALNQVLNTQAQATPASIRVTTPSSVSEPAIEEVPETLATTLRSITIPHLGEGLMEARVVQVLKKPGDAVAVNDVLCEIETDKAVFPVESPYEGTLEHFSVAVNTMVAIGQSIAEIRVKDRMESGNFLESLEHAKEAYLSDEAKSTALSQEIINLLQGVLPASLSMHAKWDAIRESRKGPNRRITTTAMVAWCVTQAMKKHPSFCRLLQNGKISQPQDCFDLGIAVALEGDVLDTAVIENASQLDWDTFIKAYRMAIDALHSDEKISKARAPLVLSSMGSFGMRSGMPIVVPPAMSVLFVGSPFYELIHSSDGPIPQEQVELSLTIDHRWVNGAGAARFLNSIRDKIESFQLNQSPVNQLS